MYIYINEKEIIPFKNEVLKRYVGKRLVKVISNPTDEQLKEFGYKHLQEDEKPQEKEGFYLIPYYEENGEVIIKHYSEEEIKNLELGENEDLH